MINYRGNIKQMKQYKVSVILPSLNVVNYIDECIQSVLNQSLDDIEVICVDAGSTDGTWESLLEYKMNPKYSSRMTVIRSEKKSYGYQVNIGIKEAHGEYIGIVETDDSVKLNMYEVLYKAAIKRDIDYIKTNYIYYWTTRKSTRMYEKKEVLADLEFDYNEEIDVSRFQKELIKDSSVWNGIYKRNFLISNNILFNETPGAAFQDIGFLQQVHWKAQRAIYLDDALYIYCTDRDDSSTNNGNGLKYAYQEYNFLVNNFKLTLNKQQKALYERMKRVFLFQYQETVKRGTIQDNKQYIEWFLSVLKNAGENVENNELCNLSQDIMDRQNKENDFLKALPDKKIIIFGSGVRGRNCYKYLEKHDKFVMCLVDNNVDLWNKSIGDVYIKDPKEYCNNKQGAIWVIANKKNSNEIKKQLLDNNINENDIYIWGEWI